MKKIYILIASLISLGFLASCSGGNTPSGDAKFSVQETSVTVTNKTAVIHLDWTPSDHSIECSGFTFTLINDPITTYVTAGDVGSRPLEITITFSNDLVQDDEGKLKFHYNDKTLNKEGDAEVKGIAVKTTPAPTYDEIQIPSVDTYSYPTLHAVNGIIGIKITNATTISPTNTNFNAASCNLSDEPFEITESTPKVFSTVKMSYDETTEESLTYDVYNAESPEMRLQCWFINFESQPTENNIYIIIALNNNYVSSVTGRTIKQNYTGTVSCSLYNQSYAAAGIEIDYGSITEHPIL